MVVPRPMLVDRTPLLEWENIHNEVRTRWQIAMAFVADHGSTSAETKFLELVGTSAGLRKATFAHHVVNPDFIAHCG